MSEPVDVIVEGGLISDKMKDALSELEANGSIKVTLTDDIELFTNNELDKIKGYWGDPSEDLLREWRKGGKSERRNKSDRKRAPKWGRK